MRSVVSAWLFCLVTVAVWTGHAAAQTVTQEQVKTAQAQMRGRIGSEIAAYAHRLDLDGNVFAYCMEKLHLDTRDHPIDGHTPFGVDYSLISDKQYLDGVLNAREMFEVRYLKVCLAEARVALDAAERGRPLTDLR